MGFRILGLWDLGNWGLWDVGKWGLWDLGFRARSLGSSSCFTAVGVQGGALGYFGVWGFGLETCAKRSLQATAQHL